MGGGDVDVEKAIFRCASVLDVYHLGTDSTYHKSVLAARSAPERLTFLLACKED